MQNQIHLIAVSIVAVLNLTGPTPLMAAGAAPVSVENTTANPVPVVQQGPVSISGDVTLDGVASVNVANTPVVTVGNSIATPIPVAQQGAVSINGTPTVNVVNTAATPIPVNIANATVPVALVPSGQPVRLKLNFPDTWRVPDGKRLHITYYNVVVEVDACPDYFISPGLGAGAFLYSLPMSETFHQGTIPNRASGTGPMDVLVDSGETVSLGADSNFGGDCFPPAFTIKGVFTGTLVDATGPLILDVP